MSPMNHHLPRRVLILWMALTGCASQPFELRPDEQEGFFVRLPDSAEPDAIVVRVPNGDTSPLHIDWRTSAIRLPNGFDSPVVVDSAEPVSTIPPGQSAEYRIGHIESTLETVPNHIANLNNRLVAIETEAGRIIDLADRAAPELAQLKDRLANS